MQRTQIFIERQLYAMLDTIYTLEVITIFPILQEKKLKF